MIPRNRKTRAAFQREPLCALPSARLLGALLVGGPITPATVVGGLLIVGGLWLAQRG